MKLNKLIFPMVLALIVVLASTGCKKGITKVTPLPGQQPTIVSDQGGAGTIPPGGQIGGGDNMGSTGVPTSAPGQLATSDAWDPANTIQDRQALAAYTVHFKFDSAVVQDSEQS